MKARFTKQHAELLALQQVAQIHEQAYIKGYMKAIEETSAPELLEALIEIVKLHPYAKGMDKAQAAIKKAIGE